MGTPGRTWKEDANKRKSRAKRWQEFMSDFKYRQVDLATALGMSRRAVQYCLAGEVTPSTDAQEKFEKLWKKHHSEKLAKERAAHV